jgi:uncharacterized protein YqgV (UPF0045/DUF77 family)
MTTKTHVTKSGTTFEWEETDEVISSLKELHNLSNENKIETKTTTVV